MPEVQEQNSTFYKILLVLAGVITYNLIITMLCAVFDFYDFNYTSFYSVIIFYLFMLSCRLILPSSIPYEKTGLEDLTMFTSITPKTTSSVSSLFHSVFKSPTGAPRVTRNELIAKGEPVAIAEPIGSTTSFV